MRSKQYSPFLLGVLIPWLLLLGYRLYTRWDDTVIWVDYFFLLCLYGYLNITALGLGRIAVRRINFEFSSMESTLLAYMLGFGAVSLTVASLGFLGWLTPNGAICALVISGLLSSIEWVGIIKDAGNLIKPIRIPRAENSFEILLRVLIVGMIPVLLVHVLTPVWDYDALLYHLEVPRRFLEHGGFYFDQDMMRSAYPYLGEMLFALGILFRLDTLSKLVHLTYAVLFVLSVYSFGIRFFNRAVSLSAVGILISTPSFILWSTWAGIDFAWAGYEFWSVYAISLWMAGKKNESGRWMVLAGVMSGLAAGTKYISIPSVLLVAVLVALISLQKSNRNIAGAFRNLLVFGASAGLVMGAWYFKNLIWTGNPVYPLVFGGPGWSPLKDQVLNDYVGTFGYGKSLFDFFALPYNVYAHQERFSTISQEIVHPLLWLGFLIPFSLRSRKYRALIVYVCIYYIWWFFGSQVIRFLLPVSAFLAVFAGEVIEQTRPLLKNALKFTLIAGLMIVNLVYQTLTLRNSGSFAYIAGQRSTDGFLQLFVEDYRVKQFIMEEVPPTEKVLFLWDGRGYYCDSRCIPDSEHSAAVSLVIDSPSPGSVAQELKDKRITHLMLSSTDANFAILYHDPNGLHRRALDYYKNTFLPVCARSVFKDGIMELYRITC